MEEEAGSGRTLRHSSKTISERDTRIRQAQKMALLQLVNARPNNAAPLIVLSGLLRTLCAKNKCGMMGAVDERAEGAVHTCRYRCRIS